MITHPSWDKDAHWVRVYRARIRLGLERCRLCGCLDEFGTDRQLTLEHIWPRSKGGTSEMSNATIFCVRDNNEKGDRDPVYRLSLWAEEAAAPRRARWSRLPVPEVPQGALSVASRRYQPARTSKSRRRAIRRALPPWAPSEYADIPPGQPIPDYVRRLIVVHNGVVPPYVEALGDA